MRRTIKIIRIATGFATMSDALVLALGKVVQKNIVNDPDVKVDAATQTQLGNQITALQGTITERETDKSPALTRVQATQVSQLALTLEGIAGTTETAANAKSPGDTAVAEQIIIRIGFTPALTHAGVPRQTGVKSTKKGIAVCQNEVEADGTTYCRRWSIDSFKTCHRVRDSHVAEMTVGNLPSGPMEWQLATWPPLKKGEIVDGNAGEPAWGPSIPVTIV